MSGIHFRLLSRLDAWFLLSASALVAVAATPALAQESAATQATDTHVNTSQLENVVVTAERREQRLQDVPIAVTAVTAKKLSDAGIRSSEEITQVAPSLNMTRLRQSSSPFIRGVGTTLSSAGFESPTATYIDGIYVPAMPAGFFSFNNIARVEVLKGPQGTLFGRNALGGVIQVITEDPSHTPGARVSATYGNYDTVGGSLYGTTGLTDNAAVDLALNYSDQSEGFGRNTVTGSEVNWTREFNVRSKLVVDLDRTRIKGSVDFSRLKSAGGLAGTAYPGTLLRGGSAAPDDFYDVSLSIDPNHDTEQFGVSLNIEHDFGFAEFVSLTGYRDVRNHWNLPGWTPVNTADAHISEYSRSASQEFQLRSSSSKPFEWMIGAYAFTMDSGFDPLRVTGSSQIANGGFEARYTEVNTESLAMFSQASYDLTEQTRLTVGLRYTYDEQSIHADYIRGSGVNRIIPRRSADWGEPTWRLGIDHRLTPDILLYASYNRGFKAAAYSASAPADDPVEPETIDAFEIGQKADLFDGRLRLNTAVFYYDYSDIQVTARAGTPPVAYLLNAAKGTTYGIEIEAELIPIDNLSLHAGLSALHARYDEFPNGPVFTPVPGGGNLAGTGDNGGRRVPYTPDWTVNLRGIYTIPASTGDVRMSASVYHNDGFYFVPSNRFGQPSYTLVNAMLSWSPWNRDLDIDLWAKNLTNEEYWAFGQESPVGDIVSSAPPRTYGVTFRYAFR